jgi:hypothetical protein
LSRAGGNVGGVIILFCRHQVQGQKLGSGNFFGHFWALTAALAIAAALVGCAITDTRPPDQAKPLAETRQEALLRNGYACCNLRYDGDLISDSNLAQLPFIPVGTPVKVMKIDGNRAHVEIGGKRMYFALDLGRKVETTEQWVNKLVVVDDPKLTIDRLPSAVRTAIGKGQLMKGMTVEQVIMSVGYPPTDENPRLDMPTWRYWWSSFGPYYVYWSKKRTVARIDGHHEAVSNLTFKAR